MKIMSYAKDVFGIAISQEYFAFLKDVVKRKIFGIAI